MVRSDLDRLESLVWALSAQGIEVSVGGEDLPILEATALYRASSGPGGPFTDEEDYYLSKVLRDVLRHLEQRKQEERITASLLQSLALSNGGGGTPISIAPAHSFPEYARDWYARKAPTLRPSTAARYRRDLENHLIPFFQTSTIGEIRPRQIKDLIAHLSPGRAKTTVRGILGVLLSCLNSAAEEELISPLPSMRFDIPDGGKPRSKLTLSRLEINRLLDYLEGDDWYPFFVCLTDTGCRLGEATALEWDCVDFDSETITIRRTVTKGRMSELPKSGSTRLVPLTPRLLAALRSQRALVEGPLCFPGAGRNREGDSPYICQSNASKAFRRALERSGVIAEGLGRRYVLHSLRRSFVDTLRAGGLDSVIEHALVGHSSEAMRSHYSHVSLAERRRALAALAPSASGAVPSENADTARKVESKKPPGRERK